MTASQYAETTLEILDFVKEKGKISELELNRFASSKSAQYRAIVEKLCRGGAFRYTWSDGSVYFELSEAPPRTIVKRSYSREIYRSPG